MPDPISISSYSTDELVEMYNHFEEWEVDVREEAKSELKKRGFDNAFIEQRIIELEAIEAEKWRQELERRKTEDFALLDKIFIVLRWPGELFLDWNLGRDGYERKATNRVQLIALGIICYALVYGVFRFYEEKREKQKFEKIRIQLAPFFEKEAVQNTIDSLLEKVNPQDIVTSDSTSGTSISDTTNLRSLIKSEKYLPEKK